MAGFSGTSDLFGMSPLSSQSALLDLLVIDDMANHLKGARNEASYLWATAMAHRPRVVASRPNATCPLFCCLCKWFSLSQPSPGSPDHCPNQCPYVPPVIFCIYLCRRHRSQISAPRSRNWPRQAVASNRLRVPLFVLGTGTALGCGW